MLVFRHRFVKDLCHNYTLTMAERRYVDVLSQSIARVDHLVGALADESQEVQDEFLAVVVVGVVSFGHLLNCNFT